MSKIAWWEQHQVRIKAQREIEKQQQNNDITEIGKDNESTLERRDKL